MPQVPPAIVLRDLAKSFAGRPALQGVDLDVKQGRSLVLIGESGSGKTLILKCIMGLINPDAGCIEVEDRDIAAMPGAEQEGLYSRIGMLFQRSALFDSLKVWENIAFRFLQERRHPWPVCRDIAISKLTCVGLSIGEADLYPSELSGGMQKRVGLARAIASDPAFLFLDDPTAGLDPILTDVIGDLILENVKRLGATVISITSDMKNARKIADDIAVVHQGRIAWSGSAADIDSSGHPLVERFMARPRNP